VSAAEAEKQLAADLRATFDTPAGRRALAWLVRVNAVLSTAYAGGDAIETVYRQGRRDAVCDLLAHLGAQVDFADRSFERTTP